MQRNLSELTSSTVARLVLFLSLMLVVIGLSNQILTALAQADRRPDVIWMRGGHVLDVRSMDYSPDGQLFVSMGDNDGVVKIWRVSDGMLLRTFNVFAGNGYEVKFLSDNETVIVGGDEAGASYLKRVRISDGQTIWSQPVPGTLNGTPIQLTSGGNFFLSGNDGYGNGGVAFYRSSDGTLLNGFHAVFYRNSNGDEVNWLAFADGYLANNGNIAVSLFGGSGIFYPAIIDPNDCHGDPNEIKCNVVAYFPNLDSGSRGITPDGSQILSYGGENLTSIYRVAEACFQVGSCPRNNPPPVAIISGVSELTFSSDAQTLSIAGGSSSNEFLYLYDVASWSLRFSQARGGSYATTAFSPDSQIVANNSYPQGTTSLARVNFWRVSDGSLASVLNSHFGGVAATAFSPDSQLFATADGRASQNDGVVRIWRASDGTLLTSFVADTQSVNSVAFSPVGQYVATGGNHSIKLWNSGDGSLVRTFGSNNSANSLAFSADGSKLLTGGVDASGRVTLWDVQTGNVIRSFFPSSGYTLAVAISSDDQTMAATDGFSSNSTAISFWSMSDGTFLRSVNTTGDVTSLAFSPNSQNLIAGLRESNSGDRSSRIEQWRVSDGELIHEFTGHINGIQSVAFSPDGNAIMSGGADGIRVWDAASGEQLRYFDDETVVFPVSSTSTQFNILSVAFSSDGSKFGYGRFDATAVVARNPLTPTPTPTPTPTSTPVITCPADFGINNDPDACGAVIVFTGTHAATATGNPTPTITYSPASGSTFPIGTSQVTATATNSAGSASCTFMVTVVDNQKPQITCPANIVTPATPNSCSAIVNFTVTATDNCPGVTVVSSPASGSVFPTGTTTVTSTATDAHGNSMSCTFTVTVLAADLAISKVGDKDPVVTKANLTYTITVTNGGAADASGVTVNDPLPSGLSFINATATNGTCVTSKAKGFPTLTCNLGTLPKNGGLATITLVGKVTASGGKILTNTATVSTITCDSNSSNNSATVTTRVTK